LEIPYPGNHLAEFRSWACVSFVPAELPIIRLRRTRKGLYHKASFADRFSSVAGVFFSHRMGIALLRLFASNRGRIPMVIKLLESV
jgi:hypothetical protein